MNSYELSRAFWDWSFNNPEKVKPVHSAIYFFSIEHCNRLGWKEKFGFPSQMVMEAIGVKSYNTYIKHLNDLVDFGFIKMVERSKNQYSANIIALSKYNKALDKALDKALTKHATKQSESTSESIDSIDKQVTNKQVTNKPINKVFPLEVEECFKKILEHFPENTRPKDQKGVDSWKDEIRKLVEIDKIDVHTIEHVVRIARNDHFWKGNFQSLLKLRKTNREGTKYIDFFINLFKHQQQNGKGTTSSHEYTPEQIAAMRNF